MKKIVSIVIASVLILSSGCAISLHEAAQYGETQEVDTLLDKGVDINSKNEIGRTALQEAAYYGNMEIIALLIKKGADVNAKEDRYGSTALHIAVYNSYKEIVESLLTAGADINAEDDYSRTPLFGTVRTGNRILSRFLIKNGADVNVKEKKFGFTPLHFAVNNQHKDIVLMLLESGADINARDNKDLTPLNEAYENNDTPMIDILISRGAIANTSIYEK